MQKDKCIKTVQTVCAVIMALEILLRIVIAVFPKMVISFSTDTPDIAMYVIFMIMAVLPVPVLIIAAVNAKAADFSADRGKISIIVMVVWRIICNVLNIPVAFLIPHLWGAEKYAVYANVRTAMNIASTLELYVFAALIAAAAIEIYAVKKNSMQNNS